LYAHFLAGAVCDRGFAELYVRSGTHVFTIQMDVPTGRTSVSIQPNVIALAKAILPKLK
jgi:hypothetical protein